MLVLCRRPEESLLIGEGCHKVVVKVLSVDGGRVRLGIIADPTIPVHRMEVFRAIEQEKGRESR